MKTGRLIRFTLPAALPLLNTIQRRNRFRQGKPRATLAWQVVLAIKEAGHAIPPEPFKQARITIIRRSIGDPDPTNLNAKDLEDILQPLHPKRSPCGLGIIANDNSAVLGPSGSLIIHERVKHAAEQCTIVLIEEVA